MYNKILLVALIIFVNCNSNHENGKKLLFFEESNYYLKDKKIDSNNVLLTELYEHKYDSNRHLLKNFWQNGEIQVSVFYYGKYKHGPLKMYDTSGQVEFEGMYIKNLHTGLDIYYRRGKVVDLSFTYNNVELPFDSLRKEMFYLSK